MLICHVWKMERKMRKEKDYMAFAEFDLQLKGWPCFCILNIFWTYDSRFFFKELLFQRMALTFYQECYADVRTS